MSSEVEGLNQFRSFKYNIPGDISSAAFYCFDTSKKSNILIENVNVNPSRAGIINILNNMGANIKLRNTKILMGKKFQIFL